MDLLSPSAAVLLAALSVFEGPATLEAVASVAPPDVMALDVLSTLLDFSLVDVDAGDAEEPLFSLLPSVRTFASERLTSNGERAEALLRHDRYVRARCRTGRPLLPHEVADVLAGLDRAQLDGTSDAALELALQAARVTAAPGARASLATRVEGLLEVPGHDAVLASRALVWSVSHLPADVDDREAFAAWTLDRVQQAIRVARTSGDTMALLDTLELTIRTLPLTLDMALAKAGIEEGLALAEHYGDPGRLARFRMWVGMASLSQRPGGTRRGSSAGCLRWRVCGGGPGGRGLLGHLPAGNGMHRLAGAQPAAPRAAGPPGVRAQEPGRGRRRHGPEPAHLPSVGCR